MQLVLLFLLLFGSTRAQKEPAWPIDECYRNEISCREGESREPRDCDYICSENGTCTINVAIILPNNSTYIVNMEQAIKTLEEAEKEIKRQGIIEEKVDLNFIPLDDHCQQAYATIAGLDAYTEHCAHLIIGSVCDYCLASIGRISKFLGYDGIPVITPGGFVFDFTKNKTLCEDEYYTVVNTGLVDYRSFAEFFHILMEEYEWKKVALMYEKYDQNEVGGGHACQFLLTSVMEDILEIDKLVYNDGDLDLSGYSYREHLMREVGVKYGIILLCTDEKHTREIMLEAEKLNMMDKGEYIFFNFAMYNNASEPAKPWQYWNDTDNERAKKAYQSLFTFLPLTEAVDTEKGISTKGQVYLDGVYDGLLLYAHAFNKIYREQIKKGNQRLPPRGVDIVSQMMGTEFEGRWERKVTMNCNALRTSGYALMQMNSSNSYHIVSHYYTENKTVVPIRNIKWPTGKVPLDTPLCGFDNSLCPSSEINVLLIVTSLTLSIVLVILTIFLYRHYKLEAEISSMSWKVHAEEITWVPSTKPRSSFYSTESLTKSKRGSQTTVVQSEVEGFSLAGDRQLYTTVAYYKNLRTAIKRLKDVKIVLSRAQLLELKIMKDLSNDHLVKFYGACLESPNCCILSEYCPKGSLQDILENEEVKLDWLFKLSLIKDLIWGMHYLHGSDIKSHGSLKSSNCVVDSRFVLKITDFGLHFLRIHSDEESIDENSHSFWQRQLWTSPELLRNSNPRSGGTQKGDVYSFAIIVHEIFTRQGVFYLGEHNNNMTTKDGLAFLPVSEVITGMDYLKEQVPPSLQELLQYFDTTHVTGTYRRVGSNEVNGIRNIPSMYPPRLWNVQEATINEEDRTNNQTEGWNNTFASIFGEKHLSIWTLIKKMQQKVAIDRTKLLQFDNGIQATKKKRKEVEELQLQLRNLCDNYENGDRNIANFLNTIGHAIRLKKCHVSDTALEFD